MSPNPLYMTCYNNRRVTPPNINQAPLYKELQNNEYFFNFKFQSKIKIAILQEIKFEVKRKKMFVQNFQ